MKKKLLSLVLSLALCLGLAVPALAAEDAAPEVSISRETPDNSGVIWEGETIDLKLVGFARSGSNNSRITYGLSLIHI